SWLSRTTRSEPSMSSIMVWVPPCVPFPTLAGGCQVMMLRLPEGLRLPLGPDDFCGLRPGDGGRAPLAVRPADPIVAPLLLTRAMGGRTWAAPSSGSET